MIRRSLGAALWTLVGLLAGFLGTLSSLVGTGAGRTLLARVSEGALRQVFTGTAEIGDVHGSLLTGLTLSEVRLFDADTTLVAWLPQVNLSYNPFDFAAGRVVLFEFDLRRPVINIVQHPNGRLNIEELLRLGGSGSDTGRKGGPHGPATLLLFRNVRITDGTVTLRLQAKRPAPGDSSLEIANDDPHGRLRSHGERVLEVGLDPLRLAYGGGTVAGRLVAFSAADSGLVVLRDADLDAREFDLEFARPFLDTLPFAGRLTGHTIATGPLAALALETDWSFRDSLVSGWPETRIRGKGEVNLKAADGMRFRAFVVEASSLDLGTVARLAPAVRLHGTQIGRASCRGPLRDAQFVGTLEHRDGDRPPSALTGSVRLDTRGEVLGIYADVTADSLSFDGLRGSFPTLPLVGAVTGPVKLAGPLGELETHVDLHSRGGAARRDRTLMLDLPHYGARDLEVTARDLDLTHWLR